MQDNWSPDSYVRAYRFAARAHRGQLVSGTDLPYLVHVTLVCMEVISAFRHETGHDEELAIQCALLHDVIEDTQTSLQELSAEFGERIAMGVLALSKDPKIDKGQQLQDSIRRIKMQPAEIWMVKLADRITNLRPPPSFWTAQKIETYYGEALLIRDALSEASPILSARLQTKIEEYRSFFRS